jgi:hypothetical protein
VDDLLSRRVLTRVKEGRRTLIARDELEAYLAGAPPAQVRIDVFSPANDGRSR